MKPKLAIAVFAFAFASFVVTAASPTVPVLVAQPNTSESNAPQYFYMGDSFQVF